MHAFTVIDGLCSVDKVHTALDTWNMCMQRLRCIQVYTASSICVAYMDLQYI
jgi:hypothetical protein